MKPIVSPKLFVPFCLSLWMALSPGPRQAVAATPETSAPILYFTRPSGEAPPPGVEGPRLSLSVREAVSLALARNFDITIEAFTPNIRERDLIREEAEFDPAITSSFETLKSELDTASGLTTGGRQQVTSRQTANIGLVKKTITGADLSLVFESIRLSSNSAFNRFDPSHETALTFTITQPLLKNFGIDLNKTDIRVATANRDQALKDYETRVLQVVDQVEQAYWDLVFAIADLDFRKKSLDLAKDLRRRNRIQVEVGTLAPIEILEAEATVAQREENVIIGERNVKDREDALKLILNITDDVPSWRLAISPTEKAAFLPIRLDEVQMTLDALRRRADIERARIEVDKQELLLKRARQNLLPQLDLSASASSNPTRNNLTNSLDRLSSNKSYSVSGALNFRIPLGNRQAKSDLERARLQTLQSLASFNQLEQSIIEEVRRAIRRNRTDQKRIDASRVSRRLAEERLAAQEKKFSVGLSTSRDILEDQESLANALTNETQALVDYNKSLATLGRVSYSSFERLRIRLEDPRNRAPEPKP